MGNPKIEKISFSCGCSGCVVRRWRPIRADARCDIELCLNANHVQVTNEQASNVLLTKELVRGGLGFEYVKIALNELK